MNLGYIKLFAIIFTVTLFGLVYTLFLFNERVTYSNPVNVVNAEEITPNVERVELKSVGEIPGRGLAFRGFSDGVFAHVVVAELPPLPEGKFYEGWLIKEPPEVEFFSTGKLEKRGNLFFLRYTADENKAEHKGIVVTLEGEENGLDGNPETHILEGIFGEE